MNSARVHFNNQDDWNLVLGLKEIACYLNIHELILLSQMNKLLNSQLKPELMKRFNLLKYLSSICPHMTLSNMTISDLTDELFIERFSSEYLPFKDYIKDLFLPSLTIDKNILLIIKNMENISMLSVSDLTIPLNRLNNLINQFPLLEELILVNTKVTFSYADPDSDSIVNLPPTLKRLLLKNCEWQNLHIIDLDSTSPLTTQTNEFPSLDFFPILNTSIIEWPSLISFVCHTKDKLYTKVVNNFLTYNPQLKNLETSMMLINQTMFNILKKHENLISFNGHHSGGHMDDPTNLDVYKVSTIKSLNFLVCFTHLTHIVEKICIACPNLTELYFTYDLKHKKALKRILYHSHHLERLILDRFNPRHKFWNFQLSAPSLKYLELRKFEPSTVDFSTLQLCTQLKRVSIVEFAIDKKNEELIDPHFSQVKGWKCFNYTPYQKSIQCYKI